MVTEFERHSYLCSPVGEHFEYIVSNVSLRFHVVMIVLDSQKCDLSLYLCDDEDILYKTARDRRYYNRSIPLAAARLLQSWGQGRIDVCRPFTVDLDFYAFYSCCNATRAISFAIPASFIASSTAKRFSTYTFKSQLGVCNCIFPLLSFGYCRQVLDIFNWSLMMDLKFVLSMFMA